MNGQKINLPNSITLVRILLVPVFAACLYYTNNGFPFLRDITLSLFVICIVSDAVDGILARSLKMKTVLGTILDPVADKLLLLTAYILLSVQGMVPAWIAIVVVSRDIIIISGILISGVMGNSIPIRPRILGKVTTFLQMITVVMALIGHPSLEPMVFITATLTIISGFDYVYRGVRFVNNGQ